MRGLSRRGFLVGAGALGLSLALLRLRPKPEAPARARNAPGGRSRELRRLARPLPRQAGRGTASPRARTTSTAGTSAAATGTCSSRTGSSSARSRRRPTSRRTPTCRTSTPAAARRERATASACTTPARLRHPLKRVGRARRGEVEAHLAGKRRCARSPIAPSTCCARTAPLRSSGTRAPAPPTAARPWAPHRTGFVARHADPRHQLRGRRPPPRRRWRPAARSPSRSSADDLFYSDLILIWGGNPTYTQIPNAHFINEARYNGRRVVTIAPDYNASAIHADEWVPVERRQRRRPRPRPGAGHDRGRPLRRGVRRGADRPAPAGADRHAPLPARERSGRRTARRTRSTSSTARPSEIREADRRTRLRSGTARPGPRRRVPASRRRRGRGRRDARSSQLLREHLPSYTPERRRAITGTGAAASSASWPAHRHARRAATIITQSNFCKFYHGLEMERAQILVLALAVSSARRAAASTPSPA